MINFGDRWSTDSGPPPESYSTLEHQERFAPLLAVATALIEHLAAHYDVTVEEGSGTPLPPPHAPSPDRVLRAVRLVPQDTHAAPITFAMTDDPSIWLFAGALLSAPHPSCACNACDEEWEGCADALEAQVFTIVGGGLSEHISPPKRPRWRFERGMGLVRGMGRTVSYRLRMPDGSAESGGTQGADTFPAATLAAALRTLNSLDDVSAELGWRPWTQQRLLR